MVIVSQCVDCKNFLGRNESNKLICKAFPKGIPDEILWSKGISHTTPIDGDNGFRYDKIQTD